MELKRLIRDRRTIQNFKKERVDDALVREAIELSLWAPNHKLTYPWIYTLLEGAAREKLADLAAEMKAAKSPLSDTAKSMVRATVLNPSHVLFLGQSKASPEREKEDYATLSCSVQIISLYLWDKGIGTKWSSSKFTVHDRALEIAGWDPSKVTPAGALFIGIPERVPEPAERPALDSVLKVQNH